jgi:hypothetical protein
MHLPLAFSRARWPAEFRLLECPPMSERSLFGMSGHLACMSYFLRRGYNVAVPVVDLGDDIIVIHDDQHDLRRVQVKSGNPPKRQKSHAADVREIRFTLSRQQLSESYGAALHYMLMAWVWGRWSFVMIPRSELQKRKEASEARGRTPGGLPRADREARSDSLTLTIFFSRDETTGHEDAWLWGQSLMDFLNRWTAEWPEVTSAAARPGSPSSACP